MLQLCWDVYTQKINRGFKMKFIVTVIFVALLLTGCGEKNAYEDVVPNLVVGNSLEDFELNDQFGEMHTIQVDTQKVIFTFEQEPAHAVNDYLATKPPTYLQDNKAIFVADVSAAPFMIRRMFIMPELKDFKHSVLIFEDKNIATPYRVGVDEGSIIIVYLDNKKIVEIKKVIPTKEILAGVIEDRKAG